LSAVAQERKGRTKRWTDALLAELAELRELDRRRHAEPASAAETDVDDQIDRRTRRLMDRFRDLAGRSSE
jgi:hypothetical protein